MIAGDMLSSTFNLQGHRGARGLKPENTLLSFEAALDAGVSSIETDLHLSRDGKIIICHDPTLNGQMVRSLTAAQLAVQRAHDNPDPARFPRRDAIVTPVAAQFAALRQRDPLGVPKLDDLIEFAAAYAGPLGQKAGKTVDQLARASRVVFDLELKRVPGRPDLIGDDFDGNKAGLLELALLESVCRHGILDRVVVRSFDHRCVLAIKRAEPRLRTVILVAAAAPVDPVALVRAAGAYGYAPSMDSLDEAQVRQLHNAGIAVIPWTVNDQADWKRMLAMGVDGMATDNPDQLAEFLRLHNVVF